MLLAIEFPDLREGARPGGDVDTHCESRCAKQNFQKSISEQHFDDLLQNGQQPPVVHANAAFQ
jgi:hypothetical protein